MTSATTTPATPPFEEIRLAVVLNGGVSLAVWMGGVVQELNRLSWAEAEPGGAYAAALEVVKSTARADVIAGTSAGGINGAALALGQVNGSAQLSRLRGLWVEQGDIDALLRKPFRGQPTSLLQGDEFFLEQLDIAMTALSSAFRPTGRPVDLTLATTLLDGVQNVTVDVLGQRIPDTAYDGRFRFSHDDLRSAEAARVLALAARCSAGFPVAFEPCYVPVGVPADDRSDRPDMARYASWTDADRSAMVERSRFTVDGGLLANTPTRYALSAIARMQPADGPTRRVMLLVHPHAPLEAPEVPARPDAPPTVVDTLAGLLTALTGQGSRNFAEEIDTHNRNAAAWRDGRSDVLAALTNRESLRTLVEQLWPHYRRLRVRQVRNEWVAHSPARLLWSAQRIRSAVSTAFDTWSGGPDGPLPFLPAAEPGAEPDTGPGWPWGLGTAIAVVDEVGDLTRRALGVARETETVEALRTVQAAVVTSRAAFAEIQDRFWLGLSADREQEPAAAFWTSVLTGYENAMAAEGKDATAGRRVEGAAVRELVDEVITALCAAVPHLDRLNTLDERCAQQAGLAGWDVLLGGNPDPPELLVRLLRLEVATAMVTDADRLRSTQPIDLVQLSLRAENWFAEQTRGGSGKLAGLALHRFGGFLKRSWRVNDWIWGRLDAATVLTRIVLSPDRLLRLQAVSGRSRAADGIVGMITDRLYGGTDLPTAVADLRDAARQELAQLFAHPDDPQPSLPKLADYVAARLHVDIILEELPNLAAEIAADRVAGADQRSRGEIFLARNSGLLDEITGSAGERRIDLGVRALAAFDAAGIGNESLEQEATSDQLIRTTATAVAMTSTLLDSDGSGLGGIAKPVTRTLRGAMLLPYWVVTGLTAGGAAARALAFAGLTIGGVLLTLSLLGLLGSASPAGALLGLGAVLCALGYAAMRSGTLLHGLLLLAPVSPLVAVGLTDVLGDTSEATTGAAWTVGIVLALVLALILLASLPSPVLSPAATVTHWWRRVGEHGAGPDQGGERRTRAAFRVFAVLAPVAGVAAVAHVVVRSGGVGLHPPLWALLGGSVVFGLVASSWTGRWLRLRTQAPVPDEHGARPWTTLAVNHPAGVSAGWSVVYGLLYGLLAMVTFALAPQHTVLWTSLAVGSAVIAVMLCTVAPFWFPVRARRALNRRIATDTGLRARLGAPGVSRAQAEQALQDSLVRRAATYAYLTDVVEQGRRLVLSSAGEDLAAALLDQVRFPRTSLPVRPHLTVGGLAMLCAALVPVPDLGTGIGVAVATTGLAVVLVAGWFEGRGLRPSSRLPGLRPALVGGVGSVAAAVALTHSWGSSAGWTILLGATAGVATVALQLAVAVATRRWFRRRAAVGTAAAPRSATAEPEPSLA